MKKLTLFLLAAACLSAQAFGQAAYSGSLNAFTTETVGGRTVIVPAPLASITVYAAGTTTKSSVCTDATGGSCSSSAPSNPLTADSQGNFGFYIAAGAYDYTITPVSGTVQGPYRINLPLGITLPSTISITSMTLAPTSVTTGTSPVVNVKFYGATGNGSTDDTTFVQNAINAATASTGCVYFPAGTYKITSALTGTSTLYCMVGDGVGQSILKVTNSASTNSIFTTTTCPDGFKMRGLQFDGPGATAAGGQKGVIVGKSGGNVSDAIFEDLFLKDWPNYGLELDAAIVTSVRNVRVLTSKKGIFYNGGTSITTSASYMNSITQVGYDVKGAGYSSFISNAADTVGLAYLVRNASQGIILSGNGHEIGTARNVTITNDALTANVATINYTGDDLSADWVSGETFVIAGTASTGGIFNGRVIPTAVTSTNFTFALVHADVGSAADTGTACLFCGDGIVINNSTGTQVQGFYGLAAQQITSNHVTVSGNSANTVLTGIVSAVGTAGTPVTQTTDIYIGASAGNVFRFNTNLAGGVSGLSSQIQTYSSNLWTIGGVADNSGTPAATGFLRLNKTDALNFRSNTSGDVNGVSMSGTDLIQLGAGPFTIPASADTAVGKATTDTLTNKTLTAPTITGTAVMASATFSGTVTVGASGSPISDSRELIQNAHSCGTTTTCANTSNGSYRMVFGTVALASASPSTATVASISPAFTSSSSYVCTATPTGTTAVIAAAGIAINYVSGSSFTLTGPNTVTTVINYTCIGN